MDLKSLNRPSIPVRHNRRTQLKPLSRLNGDWLPLLKKIRTSEMSQQVRGHNASEELRTRRLVDQWFGDFAWQLGKLRKAQGGAMTDLARLHLERRQVKRHMVLWRHEEARQEVERQKEREARREEIDRVEREIERRTKNLQREGRRMSLRLNAALFSSGRRGSRTNQDPSPPVKPSSPEIEIPSQSQVPLPSITESFNEESEAEPGERPGESTDTSNIPMEAPEEQITHLRRESSNQMIKSKVLEVTKNRAEPLVRTRTMSDLTEENIKSKDENTIPSQENHASEEPELQQPELQPEPIDVVLNTNQVLPPIPPSIETNNTGTTDIYLAVPKRSRRKKSRGRCHFPTIEEDKGLDLETKPDYSNSSSVSTSTSSTPVSVRTVKISRGYAPESVMKENRERMRKRKEYQQAVLKEPYNVYRKDNRGRLKPMEHPPAPPKFDEPTNRDAYRRSQLLRNEKINFDEKMKTLETFTHYCVQEDMKLIKELQQPKVKREETKPRLDEKFEESKTLGPADWMRVFIHSTLPEGVDPEAPESLHHCRYIRKDENGKMPGHPDNVRVSSWDHLKTIETSHGRKTKNHHR